VGYILVVYGLIRDGALLWPDVNARRSMWVNPGYQMKYCLTIVAIGASFAVISGVFAFTYIKVTIDDLVVGPSVSTEHRFLTPFLLTYTVISFAFMVTLFVLGRILSHRTAGPVYAFETFVRDMLSGKDRRLKLRKGDDFQHLEELAEVLRPILKDLSKTPETAPVEERLKSVL
jgi:signal peptidase II